MKKETRKRREERRFNKVMRLITARSIFFLYLYVSQKAHLLLCTESQAHRALVPSVSNVRCKHELYVSTMEMICCIIYIFFKRIRNEERARERERKETEGAKRGVRQRESDKKISRSGARNRESRGAGRGSFR